MKIEEHEHPGFGWLEISGSNREIEINTKDSDNSIEITTSIHDESAVFFLNQDDLRKVIEFLQRQLV